MNPIQTRVHELIAANGYMVQGVFGDNVNQQPPFAYTIGLLDTYGYELLVLGINPRNAATIINLVVEGITSGHELHPQVPFDNYTNLPLKVMMLPLHAADHLIIQAIEYHGKSVPIRQLVACDQKGLFAGDEGADPVWTKTQDVTSYT